MSRTYVIGYRMVPVKHIFVDILENEQDWVFEVLDYGNGVKKLAVF